MVKKALTFYYVDNKTDISIPFVGGIKAEFPNPVQDYIESSIGLNKGLINHP
jgi:DNA polymerase V